MLKYFMIMAFLPIIVVGTDLVKLLRAFCEGLYLV